MKKWITSLYLSLFNNAEGFSGRKVTASVLTLLIAIGDFVYFRTTEEAFISIFIEWLIIHLCAVGFFLGLITIANIIEFKTGVKQPKDQENKDTDQKENK